MRFATAACFVLLIIAAIGYMDNVRAQTPYPAKPIHLIVPLAPGGPSDILARTMAQKMTEGLKQAAASIRVDLDKWAEVVRKTGIRAN